MCTVLGPSGSGKSTYQREGSRVQEKLTGNDADGRNSHDRRIRQLNDRLRKKGITSKQENWIHASAAGPLRSNRLSAFTDLQVKTIRARLEPIYNAPWPELDGCLGVLFTSRTGSSYLAREISSRYRIGRMQESLNPHLVQGIASADIIRSYADDWFSFKLGIPGILSAELSGVINQYLDKMYFILLLRRDIIRQAISMVKANQTGRWQSTQKAQRPAEYDEQNIARNIKIIARAVETLKVYIKLSARPFMSNCSLPPCV